jgi:hypothetical protein
MARNDYPKTNAIRVLLQHEIPFEVFTYAYEEKGGTRASSRELGVDEHAVIKTLVMETHAKDPLIVLMHGDREVARSPPNSWLGSWASSRSHPASPRWPTATVATRSEAPARSARAAPCRSMPSRPSSTCPRSTSTRAAGACSSASPPPGHDSGAEHHPRPGRHRVKDLRWATTGTISSATSASH